MIDRINNLKSKLETLGNQVGRVQGEYNYIKTESENNARRIDSLVIQSEQHSKAVELLNMVQTVTRDKIKNEFETLVTYAVKFIYGDNYKFHLDFGTRGNLQELNFSIETPEFNEKYDPMDTSGGGILDIISLALRIVLMEVSMPKIKGFLLMDEGLKHLSENYLPNANQFLTEISNKLNRQIIFISHESEFINSNHNTIEIK